MSDEKLKVILLTVGAAFLVVWCLLPFVYMVVTSFHSQADFLSAGSSSMSTFEHYRAIFGSRSLHFLDYLRNSLVVSGVSSLLCVLIASVAAYAMTRMRLPGKLFILMFVLAVSMFPQISLMGYLFKLMVRLGWINTYFSLMFPYIAWILPLALWILVSYFAQIPADLNQAALIDGCSHWQALWRIVFPVASPGIFSCVILAFIYAFNEFMFALMLTTDHHARTVPVGIALFQGLHGETPWGNIMAAAIVSSIPVVLLAFLFQRRIIQGLTRGAVKG